MNKIQEFIKNNNIDLTGSGSDLNGQCVILAGYALYENGNTDDFDKLKDDILENEVHSLTFEAERELERVFDFAYSNNYYRFWNTPEAKQQYVF